MNSILTVNAGSSSIRLNLVEAAYPFASLHAFRGGTRAEGHEPMLAEFLEEAAVAPALVAHRVVHGGSRFVRPTLLDRKARGELEKLTELAPLHLPPALAWLKATEQLLPGCRQVAVFDTAFFAELPQVARRYALPRALSERHRIRRFGFHGLAHAAMWRRFTDLEPELERGGRLITLQLGSGCSAAAIFRGEPLDTSMGFTPVEGLVMASRCGDLDPGLITWLERAEKLDGKGLDAIINERSGLIGLAGDSDMRKLMTRTDAAAREAIELFCYRIKKYVGAYVAVLGGVDGVVFGGGVGEHSAEVRTHCLERLQAFGISIDDELNKSMSGREGSIHRSGAPVKVYVVRVDEAAELARAAAEFLS